MDPLEKASLDDDLATKPAEKLRQALAMMSTGLRMQRDTIRRQNPGMEEAECERLFREWLFSSDD